MKLQTALLGAAASLSMAGAAYADRGSDGHVNVLYWQAPSIMNPYLSGGTKDLEASSLVLEPLAGFDEKGVVFPRLVVDVPTVTNGGVAKDLTSITWKLKPGLLWADGTPVTSADVKFTYDYCKAPDGGCAQASKFEGVKSVETPDAATIVITFTAPKPNPYVSFVGATAPVLQAKQFAKCVGAAAPTCTEANTMPVGTGPFKVKTFKTNDTVELEANPNYRDPKKPAFATMTLKGGGDAEAAARAVMETGEFDYGWNTQVNPEMQTQMAAGGKGHFVNAFGTLTERLEMNLTDPSADLSADERSTVKHPHPILADVNVRKALSMAIDRQALVDVGYGTAGKPTCNIVPAPEAFASDNVDCIKQDMAGAKAMLDKAGWKVGANGIREKAGKKLHLVFQSTVNPVRQDFQSLIKSWWTELGVDVELKTIDASVFFGGDAGSPDTYQKFYADVEMFANNFDGTDPEAFLAQLKCDKIASPATQWQGENVPRFCDKAYDELAVKMSGTADMAERGKLAKAMNDVITKTNYATVPLVDRGRLSAVSNKLGGVVLNVWDSEIWNTQDWTRTK